MFPGTQNSSIAAGTRFHRRTIRLVSYSCAKRQEAMKRNNRNRKEWSSPFHAQPSIKAGLPVALLLERCWRTRRPQAPARMARNNSHRSKGRQLAEAETLMSRHTPFAPVDKIGAQMRYGGCSENVSWRLFALVIPGGWYNFFGFAGSACVLEFPRFRLPVESRRCPGWRAVTSFEQPLRPCLVEDRTRLPVIRQSCQS